MQNQGGRWSSQQPAANSNPDPFADLFINREIANASAANTQLDPFAQLANQTLTQPKVNNPPKNNVQTPFDIDDFASLNQLKSPNNKPQIAVNSNFVKGSDSVFTDFTASAASTNALSNPFDFMQPQAVKSDKMTKLDAPRPDLASPAAIKRKESVEVDPFNTHIYPALQVGDDNVKAVQKVDSRQIVSNAIQNAFTGDFAAIRSCRSLHLKRALLAAAVDTWDANIILEVTLFLGETLKQHLLMQLLSSQPTALNAFLSYLERKRDSVKLSEIYVSLERFEDAGLHLLNVACSKKDAHSRLSLIGECQAFLESKLGATSFLNSHIVDLQNLLTRQMAIEERDLQLAQSNDPIWIRFPRKNIIGHPVNHLIRYCLIYHPNAQKNKLSNAKGIRDAFKITDKEWTWINLETKAELGDWVAVSKLVQKTTFTRKAKCPVGFCAFVEAYGKYLGPRHEMVNYASKITDLEQRYDLCMKYKIYDVAIEALSKLNDEERLHKLRSHIEGKLSEEEVQALSGEIDSAIAKCSRKSK